MNKFAIIFLLLALAFSADAGWMSHVKKIGSGIIKAASSPTGQTVAKAAMGALGDNIEEMQRLREEEPLQYLAALRDVREEMSLVFNDRAVNEVMRQIDERVAA